MDENSKEIRELTEAMRGERDIRIRNRMMAVLGILNGHSTKTASDFADVDRRMVQLWVARFDEGGIGGFRDAPERGRAPRARYGRIRKLTDTVVGNVLPDKFQVVRTPRGKYRHHYDQDKTRREAPECGDGLAPHVGCKGL